MEKISTVISRNALAGNVLAMSGRRITKILENEEEGDDWSTIRDSCGWIIVNVCCIAGFACGAAWFWIRLKRLEDRMKAHEAVELVTGTGR